MRRIQILHNKRSQTINSTSGSEVVLSNNKKQIYGLRGLHIKQFPASLFHGPKLPPRNPELFVDVHEETT